MEFWNSMFKQLGLVFVFVLTAIGVSAQTANSPLTQIGIGDRVQLSLPSQFGMGSVGISNGDIRFLNTINPALLIHNEVYTYTAGAFGSSATTSDRTNTQRNSTGSFSHFAMSFPMKPGKWTTAISLRPYSTVNYKYIVEKDVIGSSGTTYLSEINGSGGINQIALSNGIKILPELSIGFNASFLFGSILKEQTAGELSDTTVANFYSPAIVKKESFSGANFGAGAAYTYKIKEKLNLNFGVTYDLQADIITKQLKSWETRVRATPISSDSLNNGVVKGTTRLPSALGVGISLVNTLKWTVAADMKIQDWSKFRNIEGTNSGMGQSLRIGVGGEITPDAGDISSFLNRVTYRLGFGYEDMAYQLNDNSVKDFGINFGFSLPVSTISSLDLGFKFGTRGSIGEIGHKEEYFKFQAGLTFNDRLWFIKRKFD
ncbi:MAG: outer membrane protein transport protein [Cyclobacteriaceae bacterium]|nr:outer membrane protein transport protein [Cyclobacteriaceae bacterium]